MFLVFIIDTDLRGGLLASGGSYELENVFATLGEAQGWILGLEHSRLSDSVWEIVRVESDPRRIKSVEHGVFSDNPWLW